MIRGNLNFTEVQNVQVESESTEIGYFNTFVQAPLQRRVRPQNQTHSDVNGRKTLRRKYSWWFEKKSVRDRMVNILTA